MSDSPVIEISEGIWHPSTRGFTIAMLQDCKGMEASRQRWQTCLLGPDVEAPNGALRDAGEKGTTLPNLVLLLSAPRLICPAC